jgi:hypothetical protein
MQCKDHLTKFSDSYLPTKNLKDALELFELTLRNNIFFKKSHIKSHIFCKNRQVAGNLKNFDPNFITAI